MSLLEEVQKAIQLWMEQNKSELKNIPWFSIKAREKA